MFKQQRLLEALTAGEKLTSKQIAVRFKIANPTATISNLRFSGYAIDTNQYADSKGRKTTKYELVTPSRELIAAGYRALATKGQ